MPIPKQLGQSAAQRTLVTRLAGTPGRVGLVDKIRQIGTKLGIRPIMADLVWTRWSGGEIGLGTEEEIIRLPIVPNPKFSDLTAVAQNPFSAGILPVGSIRLSEISTGQYDEDLLRGFVLPDRSKRPPTVDFFWEVRNDGRNVDIRSPPQRARYRVLGSPFLDAEQVQWMVVLERASADPSRTGSGVPDR